MMQQRAKASSAKSVALSLLALEFGQKVADVQRSFHGAALEAALSALLREQRAAEQALTTRLAGEADAERKAMRQAFRAERSPAAGYRAAAPEVGGRRARPPGRPCNRQRSTRAPRLRR